MERKRERKGERKGERVKGEIATQRARFPFFEKRCCRGKDAERRKNWFDCSSVRRSRYCNK